MIGRTSIIAAALTMGASFASVASAQSQPAVDSVARSETSADSARRTPQQLAPMVITADRKVGVVAGIQARSEIWALERENRALQRTVEQQGREIDRLEGRLASLKQRESSIVVQIAGIDSATAATRAQRERLEARLRAVRDERTVVSGGSSEQ